MPIKDCYTRSIQIKFAERISAMLYKKETKQIENLIKTDGRFAPFKDVKGLILASPEDIRTCVSLLKGRAPSGFDFMKKKYKSFVGTKSLYNNVNLVDDLGILVCPYCNRNFIYSTRVGSNRSLKNSCQLDHFFDKTAYPYFAISLFNLIPTCTNCNHAKGKKAFGKSPFEIKDVDEEVQFSLRYMAADYTKSDSFEVFLDNSKGLKKQTEILGLDILYAKHNDIGHELFLKQHIYSEDRIQELCESFPDLFTSPNEVRQLVLGNYIDKKDVGKRPLAKMTRDIMLQLDFIKKE